MAKETKPKKKRPKFITLTGVAFQMGITIYGFAYLGKYIDGTQANDEKLWTIIFTLLGVAISLYNLLKQVNRINDAEDRTK